MKKVMVLLAFAAFFATGVFAQDSLHMQLSKRVKYEKMKGLSPRDRAVKITAKLDSLVVLSAEQKAKIQAINEDYFAKIQANKQEMQMLHQRQRADIKRLLTPAQLEKLKAMKEDFKGSHHLQGK